MNAKDEWEAHGFHGKEYRDWEVSVILKSNGFGHISWGWPDDTKIIIKPGNRHGKDEAERKEIYEDHIAYAGQIAAALNASGVLPPSSSVRENVQPVA